MIRSKFATLLAVAAMVVGFTASGAFAIEMTWDGGDGLWDDANWNGGNDPLDVLGQLNGADGWGSPDLDEGEFQDIFITGPTTTVLYDADSLQDDLRMKQGSNLTISDGATLAQITSDDWSENRWTEMDLSNLTIDGGILNRSGVVPGEGGGALIFGSWRADDNFGKPASQLDRMETNVLVTNGGRIENEGQLWIGSDDLPAGGSQVIMTINDGTLDLTGGDVTGVGAAWDADLVFAYPYFADDLDLPNLAINFTGPGSITVDSSGIVNTFQDVNEEWQNTEPITYQELWEEGRLQADGKSGPDGEAFTTYFEVTGSLGQDNYTLTYTKSDLPGDFDGDGQLTTADIDDLTAQSAGQQNLPKYDLNSDSLVDDVDINVWVKDLFGTWIGDADLSGEFDSSDLVNVLASGTYEADIDSVWTQGDFNGNGRTDSGDLVAALADGGYEQGPVPAAAVAAIPEPASFVLALTGLAALGLLRRKQR